MLVALLFVVAVLVVALRHPWLGGAAEDAAPTAPIVPSGTATAETTPATAPAEPAAKDGDPCKAAQVDVEAATDRTSYPSGALPKLRFSVTNTGVNKCVLDVGTDKQVYTITSGTEQYWVSTDCQKDSTKTEILLAPHKTVTSQPFEWDRTRSDPKTCDADRPAVPAGGASYHLKVKLGDVASTTTKQFLLYCLGGGSSRAAAAAAQRQRQRGATAMGSPPHRAAAGDHHRIVSRGRDGRDQQGLARQGRVRPWQI